MTLRPWIFALLVSAAALSAPVYAQDGAALFKTYCATCHESGDNSQAPGRDVLARMTPEQILQALEKGAMKTQAAERSRTQRHVLAEYLSGKKFGAEPAVMPQSAFCANAGPSQPSLSRPIWNGWGVSLASRRYQPADEAGMTGRDVPRLKLKWAFGLPGASSGGTQPVVAGGRLYVGDAEGDLFALDAKTGCVHWRIEVEAGIRSAIVLGRGGGGIRAYFGDQAANMYAVDATNGKILWKVKLDNHPHAAITAAAALFQGILYVPVSSREESKVADPRYACCTFRGSVHAIEAATGKRVWKTDMIEEK